MTEPLRVALIQNCATPDSTSTVVGLLRQIKEAAAKGARLVALPEACEFLHPEGEGFRDHARPMDDNAALSAFRQAARETSTWVLVGSLSVRADAEHLANRSIVISPTGEIRATYDKINMFDANPDDTDDPHKESRLYMRGNTAVLADIGVARVGLTICYDLRFPQLYRALAQAGANVLAVPSAFMQVTGQAHWHTLLRARAIETGCYVLAAAQCGVPHEGRASYGHSLIVDPWGEVVAEAGTDPAVVTADLDFAEVERARRRIPSLRQNFDFKVVTA